jgi:hypothetical protein
MRGEMNGLPVSVGETSVNVRKLKQRLEANR